jgi:hypothetical protein
MNLTLRIRHPYRTFLLTITCILLLTGCSTIQHFDLVVTVLNKGDGSPVSGAKVKIDTSGNEKNKEDYTYGRWSFNDKTDEDGKVAYEGEGFDDFWVSPYPSDLPHWYLKVSKEGFESLLIDIKPSPQPPRTASDKRLPLHVTVEMRPKVDAPR